MHQATRTRRHPILGLGNNRPKNRPSRHVKGRGTNSFARETVLSDCHWPVLARTAPGAHKMTMIRMNVAKSEFTFCENGRERCKPGRRKSPELPRQKCRFH